MYINDCSYVISHSTPQTRLLPFSSSTQTLSAETEDSEFSEKDSQLLLPLLPIDNNVMRSVGAYNGAPVTDCDFLIVAAVLALAAGCQLRTSAST